MPQQPAADGGGEIDLTQLAHDKLSIHCDQKNQPRFTVHETSNVTPLSIIAVFLCALWLPSRSVAVGGGWQPTAIWLSLLQVAIFFLLIHCSMWLYQGSTIHNHA